MGLLATLFLAILFAILFIESQAMKQEKLNNSNYHQTMKIILRNFGVTPSNITNILKTNKNLPENGKQTMIYFAPWNMTRIYSKVFAIIVCNTTSSSVIIQSINATNFSWKLSAISNDLKELLRQNYLLIKEILVVAERMFGNTEIPDEFNMECLGKYAVTRIYTIITQLQDVYFSYFIPNPHSGPSSYIQFDIYVRVLRPSENIPILDQTDITAIRLRTCNGESKWLPDVRQFQNWGKTIDTLVSAPFPTHINYNSECLRVVLNSLKVGSEIIQLLLENSVQLCVDESERKFETKYFLPSNPTTDKICATVYYTITDSGTIDIKQIDASNNECEYSTAEPEDVIIEFLNHYCKEIQSKLDEQSSNELPKIHYTNSTLYSWTFDVINKNHLYVCYTPYVIGTDKSRFMWFDVTIQMSSPLPQYKQWSSDMEIEIIVNIHTERIQNVRKFPTLKMPGPIISL